jgi:hypothetical protein
MNLEERVQRIERQNRWLKTLLLLVFLAVGGLALIAAKQDKPAVADVVKARKLVLVDQQSEEYLCVEKLCVEGRGSTARLTLRGGGEGSACVNIIAASADRKADKKGGFSGIWLSSSGKPWSKEDDNRVEEAILASERDLVIPLHDCLRIANVRVGMEVGGRGLPSISMYDELHNRRVQVEMRSELDASIRLLDVLGQERAILGSAKIEKQEGRSEQRRDEASLVLLKHDGSICFKAPE